jgi:hypothetical protein
MMFSDQQDSLTEIFGEMKRSTSPASSSQELYVIGLDLGMNFALSQTMEDKSQSTLRFGTDGAMSCMALREAMHQPGRGTWYTARFTIDVEGNCSVDYDYDSIPLNPSFEESLEDIQNLLVDDQKRFPRDQENLPAWHPCRDGSQDQQT